MLSGLMDVCYELGFRHTILKSVKVAFYFEIFSPQPNNSTYKLLRRVSTLEVT